MPPLPGVSHTGCCFVSFCGLYQNRQRERGIFSSREIERNQKGRRDFNVNQTFSPTDQNPTDRQSERNTPRFSETALLVDIMMQR